MRNTALYVLFEAVKNRLTLANSNETNVLPLNFHELSLI